MAAKVKGRGSGGVERYRGPYGSPMAHVHYQQGRHLNPERTPFDRHEKPVSIRLLDVSKESLDNLKQVAASIKRLLAPGLQLKTVPDTLITYLCRLERLDLADNRLTDSSFPEAMRSLDRLSELNLAQNQLTRIPPCLRRMRNLVRLNVSHNQLETVTGLERLKKLQFLVLDHNKLSAVFRELSSLRKLEMLQCGTNLLRDVPRDVRTLRQLKDLDLSNNRILLLPTDIFRLPRLEFLNASQNQVSKIPSFSVKVQTRHSLSCLDLSDNLLVKFPGHLMHLARKLDLSANKIRTLSWATFKKLDDVEQEVILDNNPLVYPPPEVCLSGLKTIVRFFQESQADVKTYQGVKVLVLGSQQSGKSSLVYSLVDQQARLSQDLTDSAAGIDAYDMSFDYDAEEGNPGMALNLCVWDFCGDPFYLFPHYLFHEQPSVTLLTFSLPDYSHASFGQQVGSWFDWMMTKSNRLVVILVATQGDRVTEQRALSITQQVREQLDSHLLSRQQMLESRIREIESRPVISPTLSEQLKTSMRLLQASVTVHSDVIITSSKTFTGFGRLKEALEALANDRALFPHVMRVIPTFWVEVENWVEERGNSLLVPVMQWEAFSQEVLWFSNVPSLKDLVFLRPVWVFDLLKLLFRHDLKVATFTPDDTLKVIRFTPGKFERLKAEMVREGIADRDLLKGLLVPLLPADVTGAMSEVLRILTENLQMGYPVSKTHDLTFSYEPETDDALSPDCEIHIRKLLLPWFRNCAEPASFRHQWRQFRFRNRLAVLFRFPRYMPPGLFETLTVLAHRERRQLVFLAHWGRGVHARHRDEKVQLLLTHCTEADLEGHALQDEEDQEEEHDQDSLRERGLASTTNADIVSTNAKVSGGIDEARTSTRPNMTRADSEGSVKASQNGDNVKSASNAKTKSPPRKSFDDRDSVDDNDDEEDDYDEEDDDFDEEEEDAEDADRAVGDRSSVDSNFENEDRISRKSPRQGAVTLVDREVGEGGGGSPVTSRQGQAKVKVRQQGEGVQLKKPTETQGWGGGTIVLKFEVRDVSEDPEDPSPASALWTVLLPLLLDTEDLLQRYAGVLVERRTHCPLCGAPSFPGEWQTPKETQSHSTRTCDSCQQHVDTAFLVQPREKKRDDVIRRSVRRRGAAVTSDIDDIRRVAPLNPRRAAFVAPDFSDGSLPKCGVCDKNEHSGSGDLNHRLKRAACCGGTLCLHCLRRAVTRTLACPRCGHSILNLEDVSRTRRQSQSVVSTCQECGRGVRLCKRHTCGRVVCVECIVARVEHDWSCAGCGRVLTQSVPCEEPRPPFMDPEELTGSVSSEQSPSCPHSPEGRPQSGHCESQTWPHSPEGRLQSRGGGPSQSPSHSPEGRLQSELCESRPSSRNDGLFQSATCDSQTWSHSAEGRPQSAPCDSQTWSHSAEGRLQSRACGPSQSPSHSLEGLVGPMPCGAFPCNREELPSSPDLSAHVLSAPDLSAHVMSAPDMSAHVHDQRLLPLGGKRLLEDDVMFNSRGDETTECRHYQTVCEDISPYADDESCRGNHEQLSSDDDAPSVNAVGCSSKALPPCASVVPSSDVGCSSKELPPCASVVPSSDVGCSKSQELPHNTVKASSDVGCSKSQELLPHNTVKASSDVGLSTNPAQRLSSEHLPSTAITDRFISEHLPSTAITDRFISEHLPSTAITDRFISEHLPYTAITDRLISEHLPSTAITDQFISEHLPSTAITDRFISEHLPSTAITDRFISEHLPSTAITDRFISEHLPSTAITDRFISEHLPSTAITDRFISEHLPSTAITDRFTSPQPSCAEGTLFTSDEDFRIVGTQERRTCNEGDSSIGDLGCSSSPEQSYTEDTCKVDCSTSQEQLPYEAVKASSGEARRYDNQELHNEITPSTSPVWDHENLQPSNNENAPSSDVGCSSNGAGLTCTDGRPGSSTEGCSGSRPQQPCTEMVLLVLKNYQRSLVLKIYQRCLVLKIYQRCLVLKIYQRCLVLKIYQRCLVLKIYQRCLVLKIYQRCLVLKIYQRSLVLKIYQRSLVLKIYQRSLVLKIYQRSLVLKIYQRSLVIKIYQRSLVLKIYQRSLVIKIYQRSLVLKIYQRSPVIKIYQRSPVLKNYQRSLTMAHIRLLTESMVKIHQPTTKWYFTPLLTNIVLMVNYN
ncbi:hypothetical protein ACOMHN_015495 [Nucella lapillus]